MHGTQNAILQHAARIGAEAGARAQEIEAACAVPADLVAQLKSAGMFRLLVPKALGGTEADLVTTLEVLEALARGEASTAWIAMQGHHCAVLPSHIARDAYAAIYAGGPDVIWANSMTVGGHAERVEGGYRVNGRWGFTSGCGHADWIYGLCIETQDGAPVAPKVEGHPPLIGVVAPASAWVIEDTWRASGLRGTGSHHVSLTDVVVPTERTFGMFDSKTSFPGPLFNYGLPLITLQFAAIAVGTAQGAVDDLLAMAAAGRSYSFARQPMKDSEVFHHELGRTEAELMAARAYLYATAEGAWAKAVDGRLHAPDLVRLAQARTWIAAAAARVVDACYTLGGAAAISEDCPLQRRLRDVHAVTQHVTLNPRQYAFAGAMLAGHPAQNPLG